MTAWNALPEAERLAKQKEGIAAWKAWAEKHQAAIVGMGGPLGKTKKVSQRGIEDTSNEMGAYMVVRTDSHEAAAKLFEDIRTLRFSPGNASRSCPFCRYRAPNRQQSKLSRRVGKFDGQGWSQASTVLAATSRA
jgi:hypothetical protein